MKRSIAIGLASTAFAALMSAAAVSQEAGTGTSRTVTVTKEDVERWKKELSNWGRWGKDDQIGTINLITPAKRKQAVALAKEGFVVSLSRDVPTEKAADNNWPFEHTYVGVGNDRFGIQYHGFAHTHLDSMAHVADNGVFYNGYKPDPDAVMRGGGHTRNSIHNLKNGIVTRGVLIDIPRLKGVEYLEPGTPIYVADLEAWEKKAGVKVSPGDALFVRTGRWVRRAKVGAWDVGKQTAGLDPSTIPWLRQRDVALLGGDSWQEVMPPKNAGSIHSMMMYLGLHLFDNCDLEALAEAAAARKRWEFMLMASPLAVRGGTGSPLNPIAMF
jgi:kynurenine formamidase